MINKIEFQNIRKQMKTTDLTREKIIKIARDMLIQSKSAIYSTHRKDYKTAKEQLSKAKANIKKIKKEANKKISLSVIGAVNEALEEYTEANCYYTFIKTGRIPTMKELDVSAETYLAGLSDMTGELVRKAINSAIQGDYKKSIKIKKFIEDLYLELMLFDFRGLLRKKFDSIKYGLEKLESLVLQLKIKEIK